MVFNPRDIAAEYRLRAPHSMVAIVQDHEGHAGELVRCWLSSVFYIAVYFDSEADSVAAMVRFNSGTYASQATTSNYLISATDTKSIVWESFEGIEQALREMIASPTEHPERGNQRRDMETELETWMKNLHAAS